MFACVVTFRALQKIGTAAHKEKLCHCIGTLYFIQIFNILLQHVRLNCILCFRFKNKNILVLFAIISILISFQFKIFLLKMMILCILKPFLWIFIHTGVRATKFSFVDVVATIAVVSALTFPVVPFLLPPPTRSKYFSRWNV
jgi:hypothetical protein